MADIKNTFIKGVMNKDLDERLVPQGEYRDAQNITVETSEGSSVGAAQNSLGNTEMADIATISGRDATDARTIGAVTYQAGNLLYWFVAADYFDGIYEYNETTGETVRVLQSNKTNETTPSKLNFRKEYPITGVNHILGADGNTFLYWTDDFNPPRRINIGRCKSDAQGIGGYAIDDDRIDIDIDVILEPPLYSPHIEPYLDQLGGESNNMKEKFLYFAYRYLYEDNQYSALSPFSAVSFVPDGYEFDYGTGNNKSMTNVYNACKVSFETGNQFVKAVQLVVRDTRSINVGIVETYYKDQVDDYVSDGDSITVEFKNNKILAALPNDQVTRLFDNVPLLAKAQDVIGNRLSYGNYVQFRDIRDCSGEEINVDYTLKLKEPLVTVEENAPKTTWRSDRDLEFALLYTDEYGRMTTALTCDTNSIYIPPANSTTANQVVMNIKHTAPCWATHYRLAVKQGKSKVYNVFPILYYVSGAYRYFLVNDSDVDKIKVGEYLIFKSSTNGATQSNKKYKILEVEQKGPNFLGGSQISGVYFKIKTDSISEFPASAITTYTATTYGWGANAAINPVTNRSAYVEKPIHYGSGNPLGIDSLSLVANPTLRDVRFTIEILSQTQFQYTDQIDASGGWVTGTITQGGIVSLASNGFNRCAIQFLASNYVVGDRWKVTVRSGGHLTGNYFGGVGLPSTLYDDGQYGGGTIVNAGFTDPIEAGAIITLQVISDSLNSSQQSAAQQFPPSPYRYENIEEWFVESGAYLEFDQPNIAGTNIRSEGVTFRRGSAVVVGFSPDPNLTSNEYQNVIIQGNAPFYPMYMIIQGFGYDGNFDENKIEVKFSITQSNDLLLCETAPKDGDQEIFHELSQTYPIDDNGNHLVRWSYDDYEFDGGNTRLRQFDKTRPHYFTAGDSIDVVSDAPLDMPSGTYTILSTPDRYSVVLDLPWVGSGPTAGGTIVLEGSLNQDQDGTFTNAVIELNTPANPNCDFNAWTWGNGLESDRIYDDFNDTTIEYSLRATTVIDNYKKIRNDASICYSGVYNENTQYNRLNEFNLSLANFKYLDREFGSIQKLHARDTDLLVFQENKVSTVLYEKNVLNDSVGGGQVVSIPEVLGTQVPVDGEYGISKNPESFAQWGNQVFFTDARRGVVLSMSKASRSSMDDQIFEISSNGMKDYFRDLMRDNPTTQKLGAYDPHNHLYILSNTNQRVLPCELEISRDGIKLPSNLNGYNMFTISTDSDWTLAAADTGDGTSWITGYPTSGSGSQDVFAYVAANLTGLNREVDLVVTYCDGLTETFTVTQARGKKGKLVTLVYSNSIVR
jgi:hypothetical protein